jgi:hypothetical protein
MGIPQDIHTEPPLELNHRFLVAGWAEVAMFARKGQKVFMAAIFAFHTGKAVVQIAADNLLITSCNTAFSWRLTVFCFQEGVNLYWLGFTNRFFKPFDLSFVCRGSLEE